MTKIGTIITIRGKGNYIRLDGLSVGEFVQISFSERQDEELNSLGTYEVTDIKELREFVYNLAKEHDFVLVSVQ